MKYEVSVVNTSVLDENARGEILGLAKECSAGDINRVLWLRVLSLLESSSESHITSLAVLATDLEYRVSGVALVSEAGKSLPSCQLFVAPHARRKGLGGHLLDRALRESGSDRLRVWNHGDCLDGRNFAEAKSMGLLQSLGFFVKQIDEHASIASSELQGQRRFEITTTNNLQADWKDVVIRAYQREDITIELVSRAWWSQAWGIIVREPNKIDLAGVLIARSVSYQSCPAIENHVMAVAPKWQGTGVSRVLLAGLTVLARDLGLSSAISYVELGNRNAMNAHLKEGFLKLSKDSVYMFKGVK